MEELIARDIFGNAFEPGDFFLYCPGSQRNASMRLGVFIDIAIPDKRIPLPGKKKITRRMDEILQPNVRVKLINEHGFGEVLAQMAASTFSKRAALLPNPEFSIDSKLIQRAIQIKDDLIDSRLIRRSNERVSVDSERSQ